LRAPARPEVGMCVRQRLRPDSSRGLVKLHHACHPLLHQFCSRIANAFVRELNVRIIPRIFRGGFSHERALPRRDRQRSMSMITETGPRICAEFCTPKHTKEDLRHNRGPADRPRSLDARVQRGEAPSGANGASERPRPRPSLTRSLCARKIPSGPRRQSTSRRMTNNGQPTPSVRSNTNLYT